jgi:3-phosphoglycerate kinase
MAIDNRHEEVVDGATNIQKREIVVSHQSRPTDKSKAHLEEAYRDTHRQVYQEVDRQVCRDTHRQVYQEVLPISQKYAERHVY